MAPASATDARKEFVDIIYGEFGVCDDRLQVLSIPSLEHGWVHGIPTQPGRPLISLKDDLCWWFIEAFAPEDLNFARRIFHAVPGFFGDLARLGDTPVRLDWNLIHHLRRRLLREMWPTAYQVATGATEGSAGKASELIKRLTTAEQWRRNS